MASCAFWNHLLCPGPPFNPYTCPSPPQPRTLLYVFVLLQGIVLHPSFETSVFCESQYCASSHSTSPVANSHSSPSLSPLIGNHPLLLATTPSFPFHTLLRPPPPPAYSSSQFLTRPSFACLLWLHEALTHSQVDRSIPFERFLFKKRSFICF